MLRSDHHQLQPLYVQPDSLLCTQVWPKEACIKKYNSPTAARIHRPCAIHHPLLQINASIKRSKYLRSSQFQFWTRSLTRFNTGYSFMLREASHTVCIHRGSNPGLRIILHVHYEADSLTTGNILLVHPQGIRIVRYNHLISFDSKHERLFDNILNLGGLFYSWRNRHPFPTAFYFH